MVYSGGCQCGAVRFKVASSLGEASICHCRMCQKAFGSWGAAFVAVDKASLTWTRGAAAEFRSSAIVNRGFCAGCGTPLYMHEHGDNQIELAIGSLDTPGAIQKISRESGVESKLHWFAQLHNLPAETTAESRTAADMLQLKSLQHPDHDT